MKRAMLWCIPVLVTAIAVAAFAQSRDSRSRSRTSQRGETLRAPASTQPSEAPVPEPTPAPAKGASQVAPARGASQDYDVISQRNIFARRQAFTQRASTPPPPTTRPATPPSLFDESPSAAAWALTGTAIIDGERVAFLENTRNGDTMRATVGAAIASIKVLAIDSDGIEIGRDGQSQRVAVGTQLDGSSRQAPSGSGFLSTTPSTRPSGDSTNAGGASTGGGGASTDDLVERMKARRRQEEGK